MKRAKKQKLFNLGIFFLAFVLMSYLFVFPYHYKVSFTTKQPPDCPSRKSRYGPLQQARSKH